MQLAPKPKGPPDLFTQHVLFSERPILLFVLVLLDVLVVSTLCLLARGSAAVGVLVERLADLHRARLERLDLLLERLGGDVGVRRSILQRGDVCPDRVRVFLRHLLLVLRQRLFCLVHERVRLVSRLDDRLLLGVRAGKHLRLLHHLLDVRVGQAARRLYTDLLLLARRLVLGGHVDDAVGVDVERHLNLRHAARRWGDADEVELAQHLVVRRHLALALQHLDPHLLLVVGGGGEGLRLLRRDGRVARDQLRHHAPERLDAERERRHVEQQDVLDVAAQYAALDGGAKGHHLVGVDPLEGVLPEEVGDDRLHLGHARHPAHQDHLVHLALRDAGVLEAILARLDGPIDQRLRQALELGARELHVEMLRPSRVRRDEGQADVGLCGRRELRLGLLRSLAQALHGELVLAEVHPLVLPELVLEVIEQRDVEVLTPEQRVAVGRLDLEHPARDLEHRDIESASAQVIHRDDLPILLVHAVRQRGGRGLVDDAQHLQARNLASVLGGLAL
mmetsp:Transcript_56072/g.128737  ORF Transcript_56072/g.128737 Transcript_56072/m.128737 type:complete len:506 (+) Transcript_56072:482-1999(+)